jgi:hypothetical protein
MKRGVYCAIPKKKQWRPRSCSHGIFPCTFLHHSCTIHTVESEPGSHRNRLIYCKFTSIPIWSIESLRPGYNRVGCWTCHGHWLIDMQANTGLFILLPESQEVWCHAASFSDASFIPHSSVTRVSILQIGILVNLQYISLFLCESGSDSTVWIVHEWCRNVHRKIPWLHDLGLHCFFLEIAQ